MIKTFDFLYQAWAENTFRTHIQEYLHSNKSGYLCTDVLALSFDGASRLVHISAVSKAGLFSSKIIPVSISYEGIEKLINKRLDDLTPDDILYLPVD